MNIKCAEIANQLPFVYMLQGPMDSINLNRSDNILVKKIKWIIFRFSNTLKTFGSRIRPLQKINTNLRILKDIGIRK